MGDWSLVDLFDEWEMGVVKTRWDGGREKERDVAWFEGQVQVILFLSETRLQ